jgi:XTP/dITP diphosphohydrolase
MLRFVTTNPGKVREARTYLSREVEQLAYDYDEIQSDDLAEIAARGAREAAATTDLPVFVEDSGLFVDALRGFPGPYSSFVYDTLGIERVADLAGAETDPSARFRSVLAYCDGETVETFEGVVVGRIVDPRGEGGFGYDPIFEHDGRTFAELSTEEKNAVSHRGRALAAFADWIADEPPHRRDP